MIDLAEIRQRRIRGCEQPVFDVLIVGGGMVGAGVARDAQMRGLRTLLVEQADFGSGTSSRSSLLLHGGLRYLAQARIGLVREVSREKMLLSRLAPHLCQPLAFVFPVWRRTAWSKWKLSAGVHLYDLLCGAGNFGSSSTFSAARLKAVVPGLRGEGLVGGVRYFDALTNDARLVIDTLRSAESADIEYVLAVVNDAFPQARLAPSDLISSWAGVRPLIASSPDAAGAPSDISRGHQIRVAEPGWVDVAGGKVTTYRLMAEQAVNRLGQCLGLNLARSRTAQSPIAIPAGIAGFSGVLPPPFTRDVVRHCCRHEWLVHLDDLLLRRTSWHFYHSNHMELADAASDWMAAELGWTGDRKRSELQRYSRVAEFVRCPQTFNRDNCPTELRT